MALVAPTTMPYVGWFVMLAVLCAAAYYRTAVLAPTATTGECAPSRGGGGRQTKG
jgi:hypothetical protein